MRQTLEKTYKCVRLKEGGKYVLFKQKHEQFGIYRAFIVHLSGIYRAFIGHLS
jgi:hypothetical protein